MRLAHEGHHVMLTEGIELYVLDDNHLLVVLVEHGRTQYLLGVKVVSVGEEEHGLGYAFRGFQQALTLRIFTQQAQDGLVVLCQLGNTLLVVLVYFLVSEFHNQVFVLINAKLLLKVYMFIVFSLIAVFRGIASIDAGQGDEVGIKGINFHAAQVGEVCLEGVGCATFDDPLGTVSH